MKELRITRTVRCPREQMVEKEIYGDTVKHWKKNWPMGLDSCKKCDYHGGINQHRDGKPPKVVCRHDEAPLRAEIKALEKALDIVEKHGGTSTEIGGVLDKLQSSTPKARDTS